MFNCMDAIDKDGGLEIANLEDLLGGGQTREVATTGSTMTVTQDFFGFIVSEAMTQYGINITKVQNITNEEITNKLVPDATMIFVA